MSDFPIWTTLVLGFVLGLRHALDPDHLAAVATLVAHERSLRRSSLVGVFWGLGHTAALLAFGVALAAFRLTLTPHFSQFLEFLVGCMLAVLGIDVLRKLAKGPRVHAHSHSHDGVTHTHLHLHLGQPDHAHRHHQLRLAGRPFLIGVLHGLAGTAALMVLVVGAIPSFLLAVGYILVFGAGSIGGMAAMTLLMSLPLALAAGRLRLLDRAIRLVAGLLSLGFGIFLAWDVGVVQAYLGFQ